MGERRTGAARCHAASAPAMPTVEQAVTSRLALLPRTLAARQHRRMNSACSSLLLSQGGVMHSVAQRWCSSSAGWHMLWWLWGPGQPSELRWLGGLLGEEAVQVGLHKGQVGLHKGQVPRNRFANQPADSGHITPQGRQPAQGSPACTRVVHL